MSQSSYSSVNHNRQLGIVREKVPKGAALFFLEKQQWHTHTSNPSALYVSTQRNSAFTVMFSKCVKRQIHKNAGEYEDNGQTYTIFYSESYSILFLKKYISYCIFSHQFLIL